MKVALIPPVPDLGRYDSDIHLLLSHLVDKRPYFEFYKRRRRAGDYLILDNSAHEHGSGNAVHQLLFQAMILRVNEVVCSDVLFDAKGTAEKTEAMLQYIASDRGWDTYVAAGSPRLMLVPQGRNEREISQCLHRLLYLWEVHMARLATTPPVIGISKDYDDTVDGGIASLIVKYCAPARVRYWADVHCLGWPSNLWSLAEVCRQAPWVRSTDSAKPFVYARAGVRLEPGGEVPTYPHRTDDYFEKPLGRSTIIAKANVEVFKAAATNCLIENLVPSMH